MSRIAKNPIKIEDGVTCNFEKGILSAKGKVGEMNINVNPNFKVEINNDEIKVTPKNSQDEKIKIGEPLEH